MKNLVAVLAAAALAAATYRVWVPHGVAFMAETDADEPFIAQIFFTGESDDPFAPEHSTSVFVDEGRFRVWCLLPTNTVGRLRFDFGNGPGQVTISDIKLRGRSVEALAVSDFIFSPDVKRHKVGGDGVLSVAFRNGDPYMVYGKSLHVEGSTGIRSLWQRSPLIVLWMLAIFVAVRLLAGVLAGAFEKARANWTGCAPPLGEAGRIVSLDAIRILAFFAIVLSHVLAHGDAAEVPQWATVECTQWGRLGVALFFFLSGAALSIRSLGRRGEGFRTFYAKRLRALLPPFWVAYFVCAMVAFWLGRGMAFGNDWLEITPTLFGMDGYLFSRLPTRCLVGEWYVGCLLLAYILAPWLHRVVLKQPIASLAALLATEWLALRYALPVSDAIPFFNKVAHFNVLPHLLEFASGMAFISCVRPNARRYAAAFGCAALYLAVYIPLAPRPLFVCDPAGSLASIALFIALCFIFDSVAFSPPLGRAIGSIGKATYLAFLFHHRVIAWFFRPGEPLDGEKVIYATALVSSASLLLARLFEKPSEALADVVFGEKARGHEARGGDAAS